MKHNFKTHKDYDEFLPRWELVDDVVRSRVKNSERRKRYLPMPNPHDTSDRNIKAYENYLKRALFYNFTKPTLNIAVGSMFAKKPKIELSANIEFMIDNVDGSGLSLTQQMKKSGREVFKNGRAGLFVDWTDTEDLRTRQEEQEIGARPVIVLYDALQIIDWDTAVFRNRKVLSYVCLLEDIDPIDNEGDWQRKRELKLDESGLYRVEIRYYKDSEEIVELMEEYEPKASGSRIDYIPFYFIGSEDNDETVDDSLLYDLAAINIAHYQSSADYENFRYTLGQVQPVITGLSADEIGKNGGKLQFGSGVAWTFGEGANAMLLQAEPNTASRDSMELKEAQARAIGAKILEAGGQTKTATEAQILLGSETASISDIVDNVEDAYRSAFMAVADFAGGADFEIELSREFATAHLDADELRVLMDGVFKGLIPDTVMFKRLRDAGKVQEDVSDEELREQLESGAVGMGLNGSESAIS